MKASGNDAGLGAMFPEERLATKITARVTPRTMREMFAIAMSLLLGPATGSSRSRLEDLWALVYKNHGIYSLTVATLVRGAVPEVEAL
ncbi:hypothetical protein GCM10007886_37780 [Methylobacterium gregans]|nr:hypothetical protein GCM10007886_37780 [Methylobacterium gregans]